MAEDSVGQASQPWIDCKWAKPNVRELHVLYQSSTLVGDDEFSFESLVEPLRAIIVPVAASAADPEFMRGTEKAKHLIAYLKSVQNTTSRHGGAAIADHGSLGSQQNPGPVMVCSPVFNHFSPSLPRPDNYAIGLHDSGQMGQMPGHPYGQAFGSYGPQAVFAFPNHQQSQSFQPSPAVLVQAAVPAFQFQRVRDYEQRSGGRGRGQSPDRGG
jgi:hypothetical protein